MYGDAWWLVVVGMELRRKPAQPAVQGPDPDTRPQLQPPHAPRQPASPAAAPRSSGTFDAQPGIAWPRPPAGGAAGQPPGTPTPPQQQPPPPGQQAAPAWWETIASTARAWTPGGGLTLLTLNPKPVVCHAIGHAARLSVMPFGRKLRPAGAQAGSISIVCTRMHSKA